MMRSTDAGGRDRGAALLAVMGLGLVMILLISTGLSVATSGLRQASTDEDFNGALDAAYAGVEDYLARVNADPGYTQYGNPGSDFTIATGSAVTPPATANPAFGVGPGGSWASVPGSAGSAKYRYEVDNSAYKASGIVRIRVTGLVGSVTRTLLSNLRVRGFVDYIYFTDYEEQDPQISGAPASCQDVYLWAGRNDATCGHISFGANDVINGPVHSNDTIWACGTVFNGPVTTANTASPTVRPASGCTSATKYNGGVSKVSVLPMPATNSVMKAETRSDLSTDPGCLYTGPTQVTYNSDGTMTVISPWTKATNVTLTSGTAPARCGSLAALHSTSGATVPQLAANLLFVQDVPADVSNPNGWPSNTAVPSGFTCLGANGSTALPPSNTSASAGWSFGSVSYPAKDEIPALGWTNGTSNTWSTSVPAYGCTKGDLYLKGTVTTQTTAASENYVYLTGDVKYADRTQDLLGVVGQNAVLVYNPLKADLGSLLGGQGREIDAAVLSVAHTFQVQNYKVGPYRGTLTLFGSIAQKYRGGVGYSIGGLPAAGFTKAYSYDPLLATMSPPKFLAPSATSFMLTRYASVPAAFDATGAKQ